MHTSLIDMSDKYRDLQCKFDYRLNPGKYKMTDQDLEALPEMLASGYYTAKPTDRDQLVKFVDTAIELLGPNANLNWIDTSGITDLSDVFSDYPDFNGDVSHWDVSNVTDFSFLFSNCEKFNGDVSEWVTSSAINMSGMFCGCLKFNGDVSRWDVSNVTDMSEMFSECEIFDGDISMWDVSKVQTMEDMFNKCRKFNCDISKWNTANLNNMVRMFNNCKMFNQDLNSWNTDYLYKSDILDGETFDGCGIEDDNKPSVFHEDYLDNLKDDAYYRSRYKFLKSV